VKRSRRRRKRRRGGFNREVSIEFIFLKLFETNSTTERDDSSLNEERESHQIKNFFLRPSHRGRGDDEQLFQSLLKECLWKREED
jgi:hypothetical protein